MRIYAVIVAGGQGTRMGMALPKQFLDIGGKPILYHSIAAFVAAIPNIQIVLVLPEGDISKAQMVLQHFEPRIDLTIVGGGATRYQSVQNGLKGLPEDAIILVHDAVRPFVSKQLIEQCITTAQQNGSAIPATPIIDSVRVINSEGSAVINRDLLRGIQTPQAFKGEILLPAFQQAFQNKFTDEASVVESLGHRVTLIAGERLNIKITTPEDLLFAESILAQKNLE